MDVVLAKKHEDSSKAGAIDYATANAASAVVVEEEVA